jgi:hypothetical protein
VLEQTLREIFLTEDDIRTVWQNKDQEASDLDRDLQEQTIKLERAERQLRKAVREVKELSQTEPKLLEEVSLSVHVLKLHCLNIILNIILY